MARYPIDLNRLEGDGFPPQRDHRCVSGNVEIVFRNHKRRLLQLLDEARREQLVCLGAVAWVTDCDILDAMADIPTSLVVQKELNLRSDHRSARNPGWDARLREHYAALAASDRNNDLFIRQNFPSPLGDLTLLGDQRISGVRCFGTRTVADEGGVQDPLMHNKFVIFARLSFEPAPVQKSEDYLDGKVRWEQILVWTGSCNLSRTSTRSRENAVIIRDPKIAGAAFREWLDLMSLSEPLDWGSEDVHPQWRQDT
jgi:phosphatidylserine/phosphatidylglycerophosphate/cardiolipin synthase-like enzyme